MPSLGSAARRLQKARAALGAKQAAAALAPKVRVDLWRPGGPQPTWPERRPQRDLWTVVALPSADGREPALATWGVDGPTLYYAPPPTLARFMASTARVRYVVGPLGSGKSSICVVELLRRAFEQKPGPDGKRRTRFAVVRGSYRQLKDTSRRTFEEWIPAPFGRWRETDFTFKLAVGDVRSEFLFRSLDQPGDIAKLLGVEITGAWLNEAREIPKQVLDTLTGRVGRYPAQMAGGATWAGVIGDSNPWHSRHYATRLFRDSGPDFALFRQPSGLSPDAENVEHLEPGYYQRLCAGKDSEWIDVYAKGQDPIGAEGTVYGRQIDELDTRGGILDFEHDVDQVACAFDLGYSDATAIWWLRFGPGREFQIVDWYETNNRPLSHYFSVLDSKPWKLDSIWLPHDARSMLAAETSIQSQFIEHFRGRATVHITPMMSVEDGIAAGRWLLERENLQIHERCGPGIDLLRDYHYEWSEDNRIYGRRPVHDASSHTADAWRYLSIVARHLEAATRPAEARELRNGVPSGYVFTAPDGQLHMNVTFRELADATLRRTNRRRPRI